MIAERGKPGGDVKVVGGNANNGGNPPQSYGGRVIFAKELSMIMRFW